MTTDGISATADDTRAIRSLSDLTKQCQDLMREATDDLHDRDYGEGDGYLPVELKTDLKVEIVDHEPEGSEA